MDTFFDIFLKLDTFWSILLYSFFVFFISWIISRIFKFIIQQYIKHKKVSTFKTTSIQFLKNSIKFFIGLMAFIYIIVTVPILKNKAAFIFSGAGILAAIIGFAAQTAISNLIAGAFIVIFRPFRVGDYIKLDSTRLGIVEDITLRHTVINNFENKRLIIPNSIISTESILNHTIEDSYILSFNNFKIGLKGNIDLAKRIIREEVSKLKYVVENKNGSKFLPSHKTLEIRVIDINESFILLRAYVWLSEPFKEFKMKCDLKEAVHNRFVAEGLDLPIPIRKVIKDD